MSDVMIQIQMLKDGSLRVVDANGKTLPSRSPEEYSKQRAGKKAKRSYAINALYTNPCGWFEIDGRWYWTCW